MFKNLAFWLIILTILFIIFYIGYKAIIRIYFTNKNGICYNTFLKHFIHSVSENNYFMNYGLWDPNHTTLHDANQHLVDFVFSKTELSKKENQNILDVGCGYGHQDIAWKKQLDPTCKLTAVDISEEQINHAKEQNKTHNTNIDFDVCDALHIDTKYNNQIFDAILSLESAFHYHNRPKFLNHVSKLLHSDGKFVITDIMLKNNYSSDMATNLFIQMFSDFLHIPKQNLITSDEWDKQLYNEFTVVELLDITDQTFGPYYGYFMNTYSKNNCLPSFMGKMLSDFFCSVQPFAYKVAVCKKKDK